MVELLRPGPNCAYLIDTTGAIFAHHPWYDKFPENILCDIDSLLGNPVDCDESFSGQFGMELTSNDTVCGDVGTTLYGSAELWNTGTSDCLVRIVKLVTSLPAGWTTSLCADVCYLPQVDTALVTIPADDTLHFHYYFYTSVVVDTGYTKVGFKNQNDANNHYDQRYWGITEAMNAINEQGSRSSPRIFPNPAGDRLFVDGINSRTRAWIIDATGRVCGNAVLGTGTNEIPLADLFPGMYVLRLDGEIAVRFVKE